MDGWAEGVSSCSLGGPIASVQSLKKPKKLARHAMLFADLPRSCGISVLFRVKTSTVERLGVKSYALY